MRVENVANPGASLQRLRVVTALALSSSELFLGAAGKAALSTFFSAVAARITAGGSSRAESLPSPGNLASARELQTLSAQAVGYALTTATPSAKALIVAFFTAAANGGSGDLPPLPNVPAGIEVSNFTTGARTTPAGLSDDSVNPYPGRTSSVWWPLAPGNSTNARPLDIGSSAYDMRNGMVTITFRATPTTGTLAEMVANFGGYVNLYNNSNPATAQTNYMRVPFGGLTFWGERITGTWQTLRFPIEAFGTVGTIPDVQAFLQQVRYAGLEFSHNSTNANVFRPAVHTVVLTPNPITKGMVVIGFDDNRRDTFAYAYPKMLAYGFPGVCYPGAILATLDQNDSTFMNTANLLTLQSAGWDIASQAYESESPSQTGPQFAASMQAMKDFYLAKGFRDFPDGSYFSNINYGQTPYQAVFDATFRTMRGFASFNNAAQPRPETLPPSNTRELRAYGVDTSQNSAAAALIPYAQRSGTRKGVAITIFHGVGSGDVKHPADGGTLTAFEAYLDWLNSPTGRATVDVVSWTEAVRRWTAGTA